MAGTAATAPTSSPMVIPLRPEDAPPLPAGNPEPSWPEGVELSALDDMEPPKVPQLSSLEAGNTAPGAPVVGSPSGTTDLSGGSPRGSSGGSPHSSRRRGRPRKGEEMTEEERKARRKEINRLAARRAHQKKLDILSKLESASVPLCMPLPDPCHAKRVRAPHSPPATFHPCRCRKIRI